MGAQVGPSCWAARWCRARRSARARWAWAAQAARVVGPRALLLPAGPRGNFLLPGRMNSKHIIFLSFYFSIDTYLMNFNWILMSNSAQFWSNDNFAQRKVQYYKVSEKIIMRIFMPSAAYLKLLFSLLNSNQRENLILKMDIFLVNYNIVIILANID